MKNAYIYPFSSRGSGLGTGNPYLVDFIDSLSGSFYFINRTRPSQSGILNLFRYIGKIDIVFLNWIEDLPDRRAGYFQTFLLAILIFILKIKHIKIFYTLHNKDSHVTKNLKFKIFIRKSIIHFADFILCHASEGLEILNGYNAGNKTRFFPHPFSTIIFQPPKHTKKYDILIWGAIRPYKAIDQYLEYMASKKLLDRYKTLIAGKVYPADYEDVFKKFHSDKINIKNEYVNNETLNELILASKIILFTYSDKSVLSSGALIYSLSQGAFVIGPDTGSFRDLYREGLIDVFENYDDMVKKIDFHLNKTHNHIQILKDYMLENSWENFGTKITNWLKTGW